MVRFLACCLALFTLPALAGTLPAFPGAEGFGATAAGGRGGSVLFVTNTNDSGPGSLRAALDTKGPRTVIFRTSGLIDLKSPLRVREPLVTIAGQTAPGDGICLRNYPLIIETTDVIVRHIRSRMGDLAAAESDAISVASGSRRVILDHVSASWSIDESLSPSGDIADITVQWCLIAESLLHSKHQKGDHGYGSLVRAVGGVTLHHNLWANHNGRNPRLGDNYGQGEPVYDVRNNVIYNFGSYATGLVDGNIRVNYIGNYILPGPNSNPKVSLVTLTENATAATRFFIADNTVASPQPVRTFSRDLATSVDQPFATPEVETQPAREAVRLVLANTGATRPVRDAVDRRIIEAFGKAGRLINSQNDVGGWPEYRTTTPPADQDADGLPDDWERSHHLDPANPKDRNALAPTGYTRLEEYLNDLAQPDRRR